MAATIISVGLLCLLLLLLSSSRLALSGSRIQSLPGFQGPLPFELETGYVSVDESEDVHLFYYFIKSERDPKHDPLMLWLTGGPGCSALSGLLFEIAFNLTVGPLRIETMKYNGSLPSLALNPYSWTKASSIIFLDSPIGTGFSYSSSFQGSQTGDIKSCQQAYQFLRKWLMDHPEFLSNAVYIGGDSYSGKTAPLVVIDILNGNDAGEEPFINIKGYLLGNPVTDVSYDSNKQLPHAHGLGLVSDELYQSAKINCQGEYVNINPSNVQCLQDMQAFSECLSGINTAHILEPLCGFASPKPKEKFGDRRYLEDNSREILDPQPSSTEFCRTDGYLLSYYWANDDNVRKALNIRKGSIGEWRRCNYGLSYTAEIQSSFSYHVNLSRKGYRSLIYSGDHDLIVPFLATQAWIHSLNYSIVDGWRSWVVDGQVGGCRDGVFGSGADIQGHIPIT
uniref:Serine carboxypeptidase-like 18 n=1 Tax=Nelumbo nucifera TaxID=4432 RepID=A0A822Y1F5_NELNU|nr:TPA_asm: hypothetical protein HUJ06_026369 [Nelumbo nucifera]